MKKNKGPIILAIIALLLGSYIYFFEYKKANDDEKAKHEAQKIFNFDQNKVRKITFNSSFGEFIVEKDAQNVWRLTKPVEDLADDSAILSFMTSIVGENYDQIVSEDKASFNQFGLDNSKISLSIYFDNGETKQLIIGDQAPLNGKLYAARNGETKVYLTNMSLKYQVDKNLKDLRDKRVFRGNKDDIVKIVLKSNKSEVELQKQNDVWNILKPIKEVADKDEMDKFLSSIDSLRAADFTDVKNDSKLNLHKPQAQLMLYNKEGKLLDNITIGSALENNAYVKTNTGKSKYQIYLGSASQFVKTASDFRDKKTPLSFDKEQTKEILIKNSSVEYNLVKKGELWELKQADAKKEVNQLQVGQLLSKLSDMKVSEYFDKPIALTKEKGRVILKNEKGDTLLNLKWADTIGKNVTVATQKYDKPFGVESSQITTLPVQTLVEEIKIEKDNSQKPHTH
ncbi:MAG: DUF4340 domain-containing protein [Oligoflexia bacterium]|nr:DUF4340 domain-containing protein [Oligoflexia bacterium]